MSPADGRYRIDFAMIVLTGNLRRYQIVRPQVERDPAVSPRWFPIRTWDDDDWLRFLPGGPRLRIRHFLDSWRFLFGRTADAAVIHAFETTYLYSIIKKSLLRRPVVVVINPDGPLGHNRLWRVAARHADLIVPWSRNASERTVAAIPSVRSDQIMVLHPGLDLANWPMRTLDRPADGRSARRVLFVGADLRRKGITTMLEAMELLPSDVELHVCTSSAFLRGEPELDARLRATERVAVHTDLAPGSPEIGDMFRTADVFAMPTNLDEIPWVAIEALATGIPTVMTPVGGIPDVVVDEVTGLLVPRNDPPALAKAVQRLLDDTELRQRLVAAGRAHVEENYDAAVNTRRLLDAVKRSVDLRRAG